MDQGQHQAIQCVKQYVDLGVACHVIAIVLALQAVIFVQNVGAFLRNASVCRPVMAGANCVLSVNSAHRGMHANRSSWSIRLFGSSPVKSRFTELEALEPELVDHSDVYADKVSIVLDRAHATFFTLLLVHSFPISLRSSFGRQRGS